MLFLVLNQELVAVDYAVDNKGNVLLLKYYLGLSHKIGR